MPTIQLPPLPRPTPTRRHGIQPAQPASAGATRPPAHIRAEATHDLLVPNARPDLVFDPATLRMLAIG